MDLVRDLSPTAPGQRPRFRSPSPGRLKLDHRGDLRAATSSTPGTPRQSEQGPNTTRADQTNPIPNVTTCRHRCAGPRDGFLPARARLPHKPSETATGTESMARGVS